MYIDNILLIQFDDNYGLEPLPIVKFPARVTTILL